MSFYLAHGGANMNKKTVYTGVVVGLLVGLMSDVLFAKTGVAV